MLVSNAKVQKRVELMEDGRWTMDDGRWTMDLEVVLRIGLIS
ncbi:hypothetical protein [Pedobacter rhodius]|uniref:Uncharacterized protein n=1 Tax=Pedobacter rhodius TaxID=3004098 RepID=A0ABT4L4A0_9SPHI|nr:hypothetical protein [Pedobacter sp. SJ11]MCZ4224878.1 hypothetical protein [Pedobacter sp. SJ11]